MHSFNLRALRLPLALAACILAGPALAHDLDLQVPDLRAADAYAGSGAGVHHAGAGYWEIAPRLELAVPLTDSSIYSVGPKIGIEAMYSFGELAPKLELEAGGRFAFTHLGADFPFDSLNIFEVVPEARLLIPLSPKLRVYGETGLGLALVSNGGNSVAGALRFGFGGTWQLSPTVNLLVEPIGFNTYFKSGSLTTYNLAVGLQFRT
ncbi:MAG TPA: hypothetical protein VFE30_00580 [Anaeromyxobacteraceae bacterium]|nr:hypothetical protein [Anaeromyxobacteraceae bacterium]